MKKISICFSAVILMFFIGCGVRNAGEIKSRETFLAMGAIPVEIIGYGIPAAEMKQAAGKVQTEVEKWESELSLFRKDSIINRIGNTSEEELRVPDATWKTLQFARQAYYISHGAFDVTIGPLILLWKRAEKEQCLPTVEEIRKTKLHVGFDHFVFDESNQKILWHKNPDETDDGPAFRVDVGGIAKGLFAQWISEEIGKQLANAELQSARKLIVNVGGDMYCRVFRHGITCSIGIQHPSGSGLWGKISVTNGAVVTSGTYERFFDILGKQYCHILDPRTGYPIETNLTSVTIIDPSGALADALATTVFVEGEKEGWKLIQSRKDTEMILIRADGTWRATAGIAAKLERFKTDQE